MQCAAVKNTVGEIKLPVHIRSNPVTPSLSKSNSSAPTFEYAEPVGSPFTIRPVSPPDRASLGGAATSPHAEARTAADNSVPRDFATRMKDSPGKVGNR